MTVCLCVCVFVRNRRLHRLAPRSEIWRTTFTPEKSTRMFEPAGPSSRQVQWSLKMGFQGPYSAFLGKLHKTKVTERFSGDGFGFGWDRTFQWALALQLKLAETFKGSLEFAPGVENALDKAGYPC